jgi:hypothetical protein
MVSRWVIRSLFSKRSINPTKNPAVAGFYAISLEKERNKTYDNGLSGKRSREQNTS